MGRYGDRNKRKKENTKNMKRPSSTTRAQFVSAPNANQDYLSCRFGRDRG